MGFEFGKYIKKMQTQSNHLIRSGSFILGFLLQLATVGENPICKVTVDSGHKPSKNMLLTHTREVHQKCSISKKRIYI